MPGRDAPPPVLGEGREGAARRVRLERVGERQPLRRQPAARGLTVHGLAVDRVVERDERVVGDHRPVGPEREPPARRARSTPRPTPGSPAPARCSRPTRAIWLGDGSPWYGCIDATTPSAANRPMSAGSMVSMCSTRWRRAWVPGVAPVPVRVARPRPVGARRVLERVERQAHAPVADGVQLHLPAAPVGLGDERVELVRLPGGQAAARVVLVRLEHRRRPRLDHAVHEALEDPGVEPVAAAQPEGHRLVLVEPVAPLGQRLAGLHDQRAAEPEASSPAACDPAPERELVGRQPRVLRGREAQRVHRRPVAGGRTPGPRPRTGRGCGARRGRCASSLRAPVGSPSASRTITPLGGSGVVRSMPATRSAAVFAQPVWPS